MQLPGTDDGALECESTLIGTHPPLFLQRLGLLDSSGPKRKKKRVISYSFHLGKHIYYS